VKSRRNRGFCGNSAPLRGKITAELHKFKVISVSKEKIGFVGAGLMGQGMASNILQSGYDLNVIANRNREPIEELVAAGANEVPKLQDMARTSDIIHICAPGSPQVETIVSDLLPQLKPDTIIVDCSTSDPTSTAKLADQLAEAGCHMVDAPLGGTPVQAEAGALSTMVGADDDVFVRVKPVIDCWAETVVHLGAVGMGHKMKLLNNMLSLWYGAMYSEALAVAKGVGISVEQFDSVIRGSRMDCGFYQTFIDCALNGNRESHNFTLTNAVKDLTYLESMAAAARVPNLIGNAAKNSFAMAVAEGGDGSEDYIPHLADFVAKRSGV